MAVDKYLIRFFNEDEYPITLPVRAKSPEVISDKIIAASQQRWLSFSIADRYSRVFGSEVITVNLEKVKYFKVEKATKVVLEKYEEQDFVVFD